MKLLISSIAIALLFSAGASAGNVSTEPRFDGETQFNINLTGEVPQRCRMITKQDLSIVLDVNDEKAKASKFKFKAWCNGDNSTAKLVVGANSFKNENGSVIPLKISFNGTSSIINEINNASSSSNYHAIEMDMKVSNDTNGDMGGNNILKIKPVVNGYEQAGDYSTNMYVALYPR
ncbi:hypothetical protein [Moritella yayanosii]|uniref:Fimbrial protein n=1 Tax=Moritella yayanosii TaxID=69539 RepID=A0A330LKQ8_9GAMM|nr:hypothetical protein [Moritella yayanosii]SQD76992.1 conserved protein of unknown function [Moritella yayanosii]